MTFGFLGSFYDKIFFKQKVENENESQAYLMLSGDQTFDHNIILKILLISLSWFIAL